MTYRIDFVNRRKMFFLISAITILIGVISLFVQGLNLGIDFVSGTRLDFQFAKTIDLEKAKKELSDLGYENPNARLGGNNNNILIVRVDKKLEKADVDRIAERLKQTFQMTPHVQEQTVDPIIGKEIAKNAFYAVLIASLGIIVYVALRFEYRFAVSAIIALFYDALFTISLFSIFQLEVDLTFIAAILTIVGYSVNDTIVIFDRIRENLDAMKPKKWEELVEVVNTSIGQTLVRSINTVITVVFGALALCILGGESIRNFSLALLFGLVSGAYSSIFIASQIWIGWKWKSMQGENDRARETAVAE
ncbi:protein translocase subunit SecF [Thermoflavimicrobium dichotomicum]|uniref:Protein-export membrane protein SecF n=1 Tax=Thermoflavimicrobium dichotomicum TaxID=46223 RepID=A0A1I3R685_9BACL|nr:protein translocase subunit SecF [Thermoflavimicrobium dichotomicum]SFJ40867.1 preprotein translocase subunit SecF/SecD/SecF fusion protein [Thermoflavimicrobium dichotomicum]